MCRRAFLKGNRVLWSLRLVVIASLVGPALLLIYGTWTNYKRIVQQSEEQIERALDVVQEHSLKALQTIERTIAETNEVLRDLSDDQIRLDEARLQRRLRLTQESLPQIEAIWVFDRSGHPLVSSTILPVPRELDNSDRDYFRAQKDRDAGTYIGDVIKARIGGIRFFVMSQRRPSVDGSFNGIIAVSVLPEHFSAFYARIARGLADSFGLVRADGAFLARYPFRDEWPARLNAQSRFMQSIEGQPEAGLFAAVSQIDGVERRIGYRKIPGYPVYSQVGIEVSALWRELRATMIGHLVFGLPATLLMFGLSLYALYRTKDFYHEVERREVAEAALKQAQRLEAVGHLTGGVAHDFNNLLMVVKGNIDRLRRYPVDERQKRSLDAIDTAAERGANLTRQLLSFSRQQTHEPTIVHLSQRIPELQDMLRSSLRGDIAIEIKAPRDLWATKVDLSEFELAILNIGVNARDAMPAGGHLVISAENLTFSKPHVTGLCGEFVALSLSDTGSGIPEDLLPHIFEPFFTTKEVGKGTGLGLSQVYGFARQSGGAVTASSTPGEGTTITLYLPRAYESAPPAGDSSKDIAHRDGAGRILLVEDNPDIAEVTRSNLESLGYDVTYVPNGRAALEALQRSQRFDLVFSDIVMPGGMNGLDLARAIREEYSPLPILLTTGYSNVAQQAMDEGFLILRKPYDTADLGKSISKVI